MDLPDVQQRFPQIQAQFAGHGYDILPISAVTGAGLTTLRARLARLLLASTWR